MREHLAAYEFGFVAVMIRYDREYLVRQYQTDDAPDAILVGIRRLRSALVVLRPHFEPNVAHYEIARIIDQVEEDFVAPAAGRSGRYAPEVRGGD